MDIFIVDTSALIRDADLISKIEYGKIIIHTTVLEELDNLSKKNSTKGMYARKVVDRLFEIRNRGDFAKGVKIGHKIIKFDDTKPDREKYLRFGFDTDKNDNLLLCVAKEIKDKTDERVVLLTGDKFFLLKAGMDIDVELVNVRQGTKKKKLGNKGYYNKGQQIAK